MPPLWRCIGVRVHNSDAGFTEPPPYTIYPPANVINDGQAGRLRDKSVENRFSKKALLTLLGWLLKW
jgi:hypothetical protein